MRYNLIDIGKRLRELRVERGYQQKYVAKKIGVSPSNICNWEQGRYGLTLEHLIMIAKFYNTDPGYILVGEKKKPKRVPFGALIDGDELVHISFGPGEDVVYEHDTAKS